MKRHPLLLYQRQFQGWRWPALLIAAGCGALWWFAPDLAGPGTRDLLSSAALVGAGVSLVLFVYTLVAPSLAYVQCLPTVLCVNTPFYRLVVAYSRIRSVRPVKFLAPGVGGLRRELAEPFLGQTAVQVDLARYPISEAWLRVLLSWFMFPPESTGLQFVTSDWMALSRDIDVHRAEWKTRRSTRRI